MLACTYRTLAHSIAVVTLSAGIAGCAAKDSAGDDSASSTSDSLEASASAAQVTRFNQMVLGPVSSQEPEGAATSVAAAQWWPAGCVTRERDATNPRVVHIHLDACTGPFGLREHTGDITVVFSKNADNSLHAQATSSNMTVNGKPVSWSASSDITVDGSQRNIEYQGAWTRENARGETVSHSSSLTIVVDVASQCRTSNGTATTMIGDREIDSVLTDYTICREPDGTDGCPTGTVTHTGARSGKSETIQFDGTNQAQVTGPNGRTVSVPLVCGG